MVENFFTEENDQFILNAQYNRYWCPGNASVQSIKSRGIDKIFKEYTSLNTQNIDSQGHYLTPY